MTYPNLLTTDEKADLEDAEELQAHRDGIGHVAIDHLHAGQCVFPMYDQAAEVRYRLQMSHAETPLWSCDACHKLTVSPDPQRCAGCGADDGHLEAALYDGWVVCKSRTEHEGGGYDGPCLIAGWDGCDCPEETR